MTGEANVSTIWLGIGWEPWSNDWRSKRINHYTTVSVTDLVNLILHCLYIMVSFILKFLVIFALSIVFKPFLGKNFVYCLYLSARHVFTLIKCGTIFSKKSVSKNLTLSLINLNETFKFVFYLKFHLKFFDF